jgi:hypothetical protein
MVEANQSYLPKIPTARKGDLVALETTRTTHFINPYRSETSSEWTLVRVASATRDGIVKSVEGAFGTVQKLAHMSGKPRVHTMANHQKAAERLVSVITLTHKAYATADDLRAAILGAAQ